MVLRSTDIAKVKRLSLKDITLPFQDVEHIPPTDAELIFNRMMANNPILKTIAETWDIKPTKVLKLLDEGIKYTKKDAVKMIIQELDGFEDIYGGYLKYSPGKTFSYYNIYKGEQIIENMEFIPQVTLKAVIKTHRIKAEAIFNKMLEDKIIEETTGDRYYLTSSTTF